MLESLFFLEMMKLYKDICSAGGKMDLHSANVSFFFQSTFEANEMFCLLNKFVIFTEQKLALKKKPVNGH